MLPLLLKISCSFQSSFYIAIVTSNNISETDLIDL